MPWCLHAKGLSLGFTQTRTVTNRFVHHPCHHVIMSSSQSSPPHHLYALMHTLEKATSPIFKYFDALHFHLPATCPQFYSYFKLETRN